MKTMLRYSFGCVGVILAVFVMTFLLAYMDSSQSQVQHFPILLTISGVASLVAMMVCVLWVLPLFLILERRTIRNLNYYLLFGGVPGPIFVFGFHPFGDDKMSGLVQQALICGIIGMISAIVFWCVAFKFFRES